MLRAFALVLLAVGSVAPAGSGSDVSHEYYPAAIGDRWTYASSMRGRFTNVVVDTVRIDGLLHARVASTDAQGVTRHFHVRRDADRVYQRVGAGAEALFMDFGVEPGGSFRAGSGTSEATVTFTAAHDTLTVLGTRYRDVRVYRNVGAGGTYEIYFARGIGIVANVFGSSGPRSRLVEAVVGGERVAATEAGAVPTGVATRELSRDETEALALLAEVWGFVKYHHPAVTGGEVEWDAELFSVVPTVIEAGSVGSGRS